MIGRLGSIVFAALGIWLWATALACSGASSPTSGKLSFGKDCTTGADCESGVCVNFNAYPNPNSSSGYMAVKYGGYCSMSCSVGCPTSYTCGTAPDGSQQCMESCHEPEQSSSDRFGCKNGVPIACNLADQTYCSNCKCPSVLRCEPGVGCQEKHDVGGACETDADCKTNNCSGYLGICRVPVLAACNADNCDFCMTSTNGTVFCTRGCGNSSVCNGGYCASSGSFGSICYLSCDNCPMDDCFKDVSNNAINYFCDCPDCTMASAPRPLGIVCSQDSQCASNDCLVTSDSTSGASLCTQRCESDADCPATGLVCAQLPCASSSGSNDCGPLCLHACDTDGTCKKHGGNCHSLPTPAGATVSACDIRGDVGARCRNNDDCLSGRCLNEACVPLNGLANGSTCAAATDCASANCMNHVCTGSALIGDACLSSADCSVGICCTSISKCATTC